MKIGVLAVQGAFIEHEKMLQKLGADTVELRQKGDLNNLDGLILPGGESTAMMRVMSDEGLVAPIRKAILEGLPVLGTCAGMILLDDQHLGCMDITVRRNAYGRQLGSFQTEHEVKEIGIIPMVFIRAPYIERIGKGVETLSTLDGHVIAARQGRIFVCSFHPELTGDTRVHQHWLSGLS